MISSKNTSPQKIAFYTALLLALLLALCSLLLKASWTGFLSAFAVSFLLSYIFFLNSLRKFIYRKIKLIYKFIHQTKATRQEEFFNKNVLPQKSIEEVSKDVEKWAIQKREEIASLQRNEKFRKEFLLNLAHELKTPVFAIQGYIHTLLDGALEDPEVNKTFLRNATKNIDRLCRLIDDLDEISRLESGENQLDPEVFVIQDLVRDVFDTLSLKAKNRGVRFSIKKGCEAPPLPVYADKEKIRQVLINLLDNSIKYGKHEGHTMASFYNTDGQRILVELSDNGIGIPEEHLPRVFERFYRTDKARSREAGGTGLGLAIVKHIIEAHGQTINVRSKPDIGSTFGFTLKVGRE
ncbi:sensor histidine kinase [Compostibacter hankyongensis]|uniref:histidine kinase n=1 Tax=Compostibacter hankyongensis TaxID=1007089 RepID=A0ABP8FEJ2_9BACT